MLVFAMILALSDAQVFAKEYVSGIGHLGSGSTEKAQFSLDVYASTVHSIVSSINNGPNRTNSVALPVDKLYGVNVCLS